MKWTAFQRQKNELKFVEAQTHREAIKKAVQKYGIVPETVNDVRPRTGDAELMTQSEFKQFMRD